MYVTKSINTVVYVFIFFLIAVLYMESASAIPAFARKTNMACSTCHSAWPALNGFGRQYKEHGYRIGHLEEPGKIISKDLKWDESLPVSVLLVGRPYDKKKSGKAKLRALHEVELMVAGPMGEKFSTFFEIEAEDEATNEFGFDIGIPVAAFTYNYSEAFNPQLSWGSITWFDPYESYSDSRRLTRSSSSDVDQAFGGADNASNLRSYRQNLTVYGRPLPKLFYGIGISGDGDDPEGVEASTTTIRVAYDIMPSLTIGALSINGTCAANAGECLVDRKYTRNAIDIQSEINDFTINAVALSAEDDNSTATASEKNNSYYIQARYNVKDGVRTTWAPTIRYDAYEKNDGSEKVNELTLNVSYYLTENVLSMLELWNRDSDLNTNDDDRLTLQFIAAF